jgi:2-dehydropantoate 2-reductase
MPEADPVAVIGMGAVGTLLAGALAATGHPILACGRARLTSITVTTDTGGASYPVTWTDQPGDLRGVRWTVLATKIHDTAAAAGWLAALSPGQCLLAAQNGVSHRARLAPLTSATVVPVLVYVNAERTGRGCVRARITGRGLVLPDDAPGRSAASLFSGSALAVETAADFRTAEWEKLLSNVTANPLTALTGRRAEVLREPPVAALAMDLLQETVAVARAEGASLPDDAAPDMLGWLQALPPGATSSMLQDRQAGRRLEHDGLLGPVVDGGSRHHIPTPASKAVLGLLSALPAASPQGMP